MDFIQFSNYFHKCGHQWQYLYRTGWYQFYSTANLHWGSVSGVFNLIHIVKLYINYIITPAPTPTPTPTPTLNWNNYGNSQFDMGAVYPDSNGFIWCADANSGAIIPCTWMEVPLILLLGQDWG